MTLVIFLLKVEIPVGIKLHKQKSDVHVDSVSLYLLFPSHVSLDLLYIACLQLVTMQSLILT